MSRVWHKRLLSRVYATPTIRDSTPFFLYKAYATGRKPGEAVTDQYRRKQTAFPNQSRSYQERHPVRQIPTREQRIEAARRQALVEARGTHEASRHHITSSSGFHPEDDFDEDYEIEEDESYYDTQLPTSARRYDVLTKKGRVNVVEHYHDQPFLRAHRQKQLPPGRERHTEDIETPIPQGKRRKRGIHHYSI